MWVPRRAARRPRCGSGRSASPRLRPPTSSGAGAAPTRARPPWPSARRSIACVGSRSRPPRHPPTRWSPRAGDGGPAWRHPPLPEARRRLRAPSSDGHRPSPSPPPRVPSRRLRRPLRSTLLPDRVPCLRGGAGGGGERRHRHPRVRRLPPRRPRRAHLRCRSIPVAGPAWSPRFLLMVPSAGPSDCASALRSPATSNVRGSSPAGRRRPVNLRCPRPRARRPSGMASRSRRRRRLMRRASRRSTSRSVSLLRDPCRDPLGGPGGAAAPSPAPGSPQILPCPALRPGQQARPPVPFLPRSRSFLSVWATPVKDRARRRGEVVQTNGLRTPSGRAGAPVGANVQSAC